MKDKIYYRVFAPNGDYLFYKGIPCHRVEFQTKKEANRAIAQMMHEMKRSRDYYFIAEIEYDE